MAKARVKVPKKAKKGEVITIKTLIKHKMQRATKDKKTGKPIPRNIIHTFEAKFNGKTFLTGEWDTGISANPYCAFTHRVQESGEYEFVWKDDAGQTYTAKAKIEVA